MSAETEINVERVIGNAVIELIRTQPFFGNIISQLPRVFDDAATPTLAVGRREGEFLVTLYVNPAYVRELYRKATEGMRGDRHAAFAHLVEVLKHETLHVAFGHIFKKTAPDANAQTLAFECEVNSYVDRKRLLDEAVFAEQFGLPDKLGYDRYYTALAKRNAEEKGGCGKPEKTEGRGKPEKGAGNAAASGKGKKPEAGTVSPAGANGKPEKGDGKSKPEGRTGGGERQAPAPLDDHSLWKGLSAEGADGATGLLVKDILRKAREAAKDSAAWGDVPAALRTALDTTLDPAKAKVPWQSVLRDFAASASESQLSYTNRRLSRRFGTRPGTYKESLLKLAVGIDTSGSISKAMLELFLTEIRALERTTAAEITVFECDCAIQRESPLSQFDPSHLCGGGGTRLDPVFRAAANRRFDALIYFTDGYAPPVKEDWKIPTLLVIDNPMLHRGDGGFVYPKADFVFFRRSDGTVEVE